MTIVSHFFFSVKILYETCSSDEGCDSDNENEGKTVLDVEDLGKVMGNLKKAKAGSLCSVPLDISLRTSRKAIVIEFLMEFVPTRHRERRKRREPGTVSREK